MLTRSEVGQHASRKSCWVVINSNAYDVTDFIDAHPGGANIILKYAGRDATEAFEPVHPSDTLEKHLKPEQNLGPVSGDAPVPQATKSKTTASQAQDVVVAQAKPKKVRLSSIISIQDFETAASKVLSKRSFAFFKTGAEDEVTSNWNRDSWKLIRFRPRVLRPIESVDISTTIHGSKFSAPFLICPAGGGKLANRTGEILLTKAAGKHDILHWVCNNAGCTQGEMADVRVPRQALYWQIYAMSDLAVTEKEIKSAVARGFKGFALTVDAIRAGKRERDMRTSMEEEEEEEEDADDAEEEEEDESFTRGPTVKRAAVYERFDWVSSIKWLRSLTDLPIAIKGIQCWEDAALCMKYGAHPWLSNHGARQLDGAPSAVDTLIEIRQHCPEVLKKCEVIVDGGVTRGTDIVKALALGAKGVGLGRAFLYSLVFGEAGVSKAIRILKHEVETTMALLGVTSIDQLNASYVDYSRLLNASPEPRARLIYTEKTKEVFTITSIACPILAMEDPLKTAPPPLPSAPAVELSATLTLQPPLSRRGHGPGIVIVVSDEADIKNNTNPSKTLDPVPIQKWAEEGYAVAQLKKPGGDASSWKLGEELKSAIDVLKSHDTCTEKSKFAVVVYSSEGITEMGAALDSNNEIVAVVSFGELPQPCKAPKLSHIIEKGIPKSTTTNGDVIYRYDLKSPRFVLPTHAHFAPAPASVAHSRSLEFIKRRVDGPWFDLEAIWDEHTSFEFSNRSVEHTMATMVQEPYVNHIPTMTGGIGREKLSAFYAHHFIFNNPDDANLELVSRTVGIDRIVDEFLFCMTHDKEVDWLIPGIPPTGKYVRIPFTAVVNIRGDRLYHEHISWDQLTVLFQLGLMPEYLPFPSSDGKKLEYRVPGGGVECAEKLEDENAAPSNEMFKFAVREASS